MYSKLPNLILGFHGCDYSTLEKVVFHGEPMHASENDYDWLGHGMYFWEQNFERAFAWAQEQVKRGVYGKPAVIGAVIDLGNCLNLMDSASIGIVKEEYELLHAEFELLGRELPQNHGRTQDRLFRNLDCAVIEHLHERIESASFSGVEPYDSVRGLFTEGQPIYPGSGFYEKTHIQLCVRNPNCIKGYFMPRVGTAEWPLP